MKAFALTCLLLVAAVSCAEEDLSAKIRELQKQLQDVQMTLNQERQYQPTDVDRAREVLFGQPQQPQKRMVAWQPMKRSLDEVPMKRGVAWQPMKRTVDVNEPVIRAVEARLLEVLSAGERLGVSADDVLTHLRLRQNTPQ